MIDASQYSYTRAIRFNLEESEGKLNNIQKENIEHELDMADFVTKGQRICQDLKSFLYSKDKESNFKKDKKDNLIFDSLISVKKDWLKKYFKNDFYINSTKQKYHFVSKTVYLKDGFNNWFDEFEENLSEIKKLNNKALKISEERQVKIIAFRTEISFYISKISANKNFGFVKDFIESANHKNNATKLYKLKKSINDFEILLNHAQYEYLPSQSAGLCISKGSMNYYTVNKKPKEYYDKELEGLEEEKKKNYGTYDKNTKLEITLNQGGFNSNSYDIKLKETEKSWIQKKSKIKNSPEQEVKFDLEETYELMKEFKANMKRQLYEQINQSKTLEEIKESFTLFEDEYCLKEVMNLTKQINKLNMSQPQDSSISDLRQTRGKYFIKKLKFSKERGKKIPNKHFENYFNFCEKFKEIAKKRGKLKAQSKGVEREKIESENNKYWVLLLKEKQEKFLLLIPKEKMKEAKEDLEKMQHEAGSDMTVHVMKSLTQRALHKLCFSEESTFAKEMKKEQPDLYQSLQEVKKATNDKTQLSKNRRRNPEEKSKEDLMLPFLKKVLTSDYANKRLDLKPFDLTKVLNAENFNDFELELEKTCYDWQSIYIQKEEAKNLIDKYSIIKCRITSYDLEDRNLNTFQTPESAYESHTETMWNEFWKEKDDVRLNPEIKIHFKKHDPELKQYLTKRNFDINKIKNRNLEDKYTVTMSFSLNAGKKYPKLAFADSKTLLGDIDQFNYEFNKRNWKDFYKYGIDRGNIEFATVCIAKFNENEIYKVKVNGETKDIPKPKFPEGDEDIKCYELKKHYYDKKFKSDLENPPYDKRKEKRVIANISYFIDKVENKEWFEEKNCTCIDLTTAKVIKDKIILNGDVLTFLKLKKEGAKRLIFENYNKDSELNWDKENSSSICMKMDDEEIYYFDKKFEGLLIKDNVKHTADNTLESLKAYLKELKINGNSEHKPSVEKLNHLRDSIASNMVGVITLLQKTYPGFVILEDLDLDTVKEQFSDLYINVSNRLEFKLLNKFQTLGLAPPHIKSLIEIRENKRNEIRKEIEEKVKENLSIENIDEISKTKMKKLISETDKYMKDYSQQFGSIIFVDEKGTSSSCPYCEKEINYDKERRRSLKFEEKRFVCGEHKDNECEFDTSNIKEKYSFLKEIDDPDKVASYNVAKKIKKYEKIQKLSES